MAAAADPVCKALMMQLADAIEQWGIAHRTRMDESDAALVRSVWATIRRSKTADFDVDNLTSEDSRQVMALFERKRRGDVATVLNIATKWSRTEARRELERATSSRFLREESTAASAPAPSPELTPPAAGGGSDDATTNGRVPDAVAKPERKLSERRRAARARAAADNGTAERRDVDPADADEDAAGDDTDAAAEETEDVVEDAVDQLDIDEPEVAEPEAAELEAAGPEVAESEAAEPEVAESEVAELEVAESDAAEPEADEIDVDRFDSDALSRGGLLSQAAIGAGLFVDVDVEAEPATDRLPGYWYAAAIVIGILTLISIGILVYFLLLA